MTRRRLARIRRAYNAYRKQTPILNGWRLPRFDIQAERCDLAPRTEFPGGPYIKPETRLRWIGDIALAGLR